MRGRAGRLPRMTRPCRRCHPIARRRPPPVVSRQQHGAATRAPEGPRPAQTPGGAEGFEPGRRLVEEKRIWDAHEQHASASSWAGARKLAHPGVALLGRAAMSSSNASRVRRGAVRNADRATASHRPTDWPTGGLCSATPERCARESTRRRGARSARRAERRPPGRGPAHRGSSTVVVLPEPLGSAGRSNRPAAKRRYARRRPTQLPGEGAPLSRPPGRPCAVTCSDGAQLRATGERKGALGWVAELPAI